MNIAITSASGNVGKSTICLNMALALNENFENIKLYDADERMETLKEIMQIRKKSNLFNIEVFTNTKEIEKGLEDKANLVVVITTNEDLVLKKTKKFCLDLEENNINYLVLINKFNDKLNDFETINKMFNNKLFKTYLKDKISYKRVDEDGSLFFDKKDKMIGLRPTKNEFDNFINEFIEIIENL